MRAFYGNAQKAAELHWKLIGRRGVGNIDRECGGKKKVTFAKWIMAE